MRAAFARSSRSILVFPLALIALAGCGSKTSIWTPPTRDGGPPMDGAIDGGSDAGVDGGGGIVVDCGRSEQFTTPRREIVLEAEATSDVPIATSGWTMVERPDASVVTNAPTEGLTTALTPDVLGLYLLRFDATDARGRGASCEVRVQAIVGPPVALCPEEELVTAQGAPILVVGDAFDDDEVASATWSQVSGPAEARLEVLGDGTGTTVEFVADVAGIYRLALEVVDIDGETDRCEIEVRVSAPPVVSCDPTTVMAPTRQPVTVRARATDERMVVSTSWELVTRPTASSATIRPTTGLSTTMTPDRQGEYELRFTATDDDGLSSFCTVTVIGTPTPPTVMCPMVVETAPLLPTEIVASAVDDGTIASWAWRVVEVPPGSRPGAPAPANQARTVFTPDLAGEYRLRVIATDDDGQASECETLVRAISGDGLRVEVSWDTNGTDMDTHVLRPGARAWFDGTDDCFYSNCVTRGGEGVLEWGAPGVVDDNPRLDIDDTDGFGPENINVRRPVPGTYRVGVHAYRGFGRVTVRVYCGGSTTMPRQTFGPVAIDGARLWRVADVDITAAGCTIRDLASGGRPNIISREQANMAP